MPRYLFETTVTSQPERDSAERLAASRFPEVAVEHRFAAHDGDVGSELWVCRAPSASHVHRFAAAARLSLASLRHVDDVTPRPGEAPPPSGTDTHRPMRPDPREVR